MKRLLGLFTAIKAATMIVTMDTRIVQSRTAELYIDRMTAEATRIENEIKKNQVFIKTGGTA
jgi:hypothetical protein